METDPEGNDLRTRIDQAFDEALDLAPEEWEAFLASLRTTDPSVHAEVRALLEAHARTEGLLEDEAMEAVASMAEDALKSIRIGPYRTLRELGRGGMALVYLAERADGQFEQKVAIKIIRGRPDALELHRRFLAERQILASLNHPGIARLLDGGLSPGGLPYLVMEYVDGLPVLEFCDQNRLDLEGRLRLFRKVCDAVHYAHQNLVIHRDLKPSNIMVTAGGDVKLLDFGIAKLLDPDRIDAPVTRTEHRVMTPEYASPEQVRGEPLTTASDVYSLGVVLYELLSGHRPYRLHDLSTVEVLRQVCDQDPERPSTRVLQTEEVTRSDGTTTTISPVDVGQTRNLSAERLRRRLRGDLDNIAMKALRKDAHRRYGSAELFGQDLGRYLVGLPVTAHKGTTWYRAQKFFQRHRAQSAAAALAGLSLLVGAGAAFWQARVAATERDRAESALAQAEQALGQSEEVRRFLIGLFEASDPLEARGDTLDAGDLMARGLARVEELEGQPAVQADMLDAIGQVYYSLGRFDEAESHVARSLDLRQQVYGPEDPRVAESLDRLGEMLRHNGNYEAAEARYRQGLALRRASLAPDDPRIALSLTHLSVQLRTIGEYEEAEAVQREATAILRNAPAADPLDLAYGLRNLGWIRSLRGDDTEAETVYRNALEIREAQLGEAHPDVAAMKILIADLLLARGAPEDAEPLYREALATRRAFMGDRHPFTASTLNNLGLVAQAKGDPVEGERLHRAALEIWYETLGPDHAYVAWGLNDLSMALLAQGEVEEAVDPQTRSLTLRRELLGDLHPDVALGLHNMGLILTAQGHLDRAETQLEQALDMRRTLLGPDHPDVIPTLQALARVHSQLGRPDLAVALLEEAVQVSVVRFGGDDVRTRALYLDLAGVHEARGDAEAAAGYRRRTGA